MKKEDFEKAHQIAKDLFAIEKDVQRLNYLKQGIIPRIENEEKYGNSNYNILKLNFDDIVFEINLNLALELIQLIEIDITKRKPALEAEFEAL